MIITIKHPTENKFYEVIVRRDPHSGGWFMKSQTGEGMSFDDEQLFSMYDDFFKKHF